MPQTRGLESLVALEWVLCPSNIQRQLRDYRLHNVSTCVLVCPVPKGPYSLRTASHLLQLTSTKLHDDSIEPDRTCSRRHDEDEGKGAVAVP